MLLTQAVTEGAARFEIGVLGEGRYIVTAIPALNAVNMCDVEHTQQHNRSDGCTHTLHVIMADALHWVVVVWGGSTTESVQWTTAFFAAFVAVRTLVGEDRNKTHFACNTGHLAYPHCSFSQRVRVFSRSRSNSSGRGVILSIPHPGSAPERGFVQIWRRKCAVNRDVPALVAFSVATDLF